MKLLINSLVFTLLIYLVLFLIVFMSMIKAMKINCKSSRNQTTTNHVYQVLLECIGNTMFIEKSLINFNLNQKSLDNASKNALIIDNNTYLISDIKNNHKNMTITLKDANLDKTKGLYLLYFL